VVESLRRGEVPNEDFESILVDRRDILKAFDEDLEFLSQNSSFKTRYLKGGFGAGKTFVLKMLQKKALKEKFAVSYIVLDEISNRFDKLDNIYNAIMHNLKVDNLPPGSVSLAEIIAYWNKMNPDAHTRESKPSLFRLTPANPYLAILLHFYHIKPEFRSQILSWVMGEKTIHYFDKIKFGVKGDIDRTNCLNYLNAITTLIKQANYKGTIIIFDEVESINRLQKSHRLAALENIRLLDDNTTASLGNTGLYFGGATEFFEGDDGIKSYDALKTRLQTFSGFKSYRQTILELDHFDKRQRKKLLENVKKVYEKAYETSLSHVTGKIIDEAEKRSSSKQLDAREVVRRWITYLDRETTHFPT